MRVILLGPPGSGKSTLSENLVKEFNFLHLSPGEILREEVRKGTTLGKDIQVYIERGDLVPAEIVVGIVKLELKDHDHFILDGFPRDLAQVQAIEDLKIDLVLVLAIPEGAVIERLSGRKYCPQCGLSYHSKSLPQKVRDICDQCGTLLTQRADDRPESIQERFVVYHQEAQPVIDYYRQKGLVHFVNANQEPEKVAAEAIAILQERMESRLDSN